MSRTLFAALLGAGAILASGAVAQAHDDDYGGGGVNRFLHEYGVPHTHAYREYEGYNRRPTYHDYLHEEGIAHGGYNHYLHDRGIPHVHERRRYYDDDE